MAAEELHRPLPEPGSGGALLVEMFLGVGEPGVVIDGGVEVHVPGAGAGALGSAGDLVLRRPAAVDPPPSAVGDPAQLLHIDVDQVAGAVPFVALDRLAQVLPGHIEVA